MTKVICKDIPGYEGLYKASSKGEILNSITGKVLKQSKKIKYSARVIPYRYLNLRKNGTTKTFVVHRLIAKTFLGDPPVGTVVMHKDDNPSNNSVDNLSYGTQKENVADCAKKGRRCLDRKQLAAANDIAKKKSSKPIAAIKDGEQREFASINEAKRVLKVTRIWSVLNGKREMIKGYSFKYI